MSVSETMEAVPVMLGVSTLPEVSAVSVMMDSVGMAMSVEVCHPLPSYLAAPDLATTVLRFSQL